MQRLVIILLAAMGIAAYAAAADTGDALATKAVRAYDAAEWPNAAALYMLVIDRQPDNAPAYGRLMAAQQMMGDTAGIVATAERALAHAMPLDTLLEYPRAAAFAHDTPGTYESTLLQLQRSLPWLSRALDIRLLQYYTARRDRAGIEAYARRMLTLNPGDTHALYLMASSALAAGDIASAQSYWTRILAIDPDDYDALAAMATTLADTDHAAAAAYARRALAIRPNPALEAIAR